MSRQNLSLVASSLADADIQIPDANHSAVFQAEAAFRAISQPADKFLRLPFQALSDVIGDIPEGDLWYVGAFSGDGKTAFFTSLALALIEQGKKVYYVPTETPPKTVRAHFACKALGYDVGDFLSGSYRAWPDAEGCRAAIKAELKRQTDQQSLWVAEAGMLTSLRLEGEAAHAKELGADVFIVDHIDHVEGTGVSLYEASVEANKTLLHCTQTYGLRGLAATQFNLQATIGSRTTRYLPPKENVVLWGNYKRTIASGMLGIYRPLKLHDLDIDLLKRFNKGDTLVEPKDILEPNIMAIAVMKHRLYGAREGKRVMLDVHHGRVRDLTPLDREALANGIRP
jgi:hypothetical protein